MHEDHFFKIFAVTLQMTIASASWRTDSKLWRDRTSTAKRRNPTFGDRTSWPRRLIHNNELQTRRCERILQKDADVLSGSSDGLQRDTSQSMQDIAQYDSKCLRSFVLIKMCSEQHPKPGRKRKYHDVRYRIDLRRCWYIRHLHF